MRYRRRLHRRDAKKQKKIIVFSLFAALLCLSISYAAFSTNINLTAKGNVYKVSDKCYRTSDNGDGTVTITDYDKSCGTEVNIPSTIKGLTVTKIGDNSFQNKGITKLTLPDTLLEIGVFAFHLNKIETLTLPDNLKTVKAYAFRLNSIQKLNLNDGLEEIGLDAFDSNYLTEIKIPSSVTKLGGGAFAKNNLKGDAAFIYGINSDGSTNYSVLNSYAGKDATGTFIPDTVTVIQTEAYVNVHYEEITIPGRIKEIDGYTFYNSEAKKITIEEGVEEISSYAFSKSNITSINLPSTIKTLGYAFSDTPTLKKINICKKENTIEGTPWGATNATVNWIGTN